MGGFDLTLSKGVTHLLFSFSFYFQEIDASAKRQHIFSDLRPNATYELKVSARNNEGIGPWATTIVKTLAPIQGT
jgi:hypothetical protein